MADKAIIYGKSVDVVIPAYRPGGTFLHLLERLGKQSYPVRRIIIMNTEESFWNAEYEGFKGVEVHHVSKSEFDHGGTRNEGASYSDADILIFMTDDALPGDRDVISALVRGFEHKGPAGEPVAVVYARQLPGHDCALAERYTRAFNYPEKGRVKTKKDLGGMGIKAFFVSNACCAYDRTMFMEAGGFTQPAIFNEDMIYAGNALLHRGQAVVYAADAKVIHSHNYNCLMQMKRNFDLAVSQADHPEVFLGIPSEGEGIRLVKGTCGWLAKRKKPWLIPGMLVKSGFKYLGYLLGKNYRRLPAWLVSRLTLNREYWRHGNGGAGLRRGV